MILSRQAFRVAVFTIAAASFSNAAFAAGDGLTRRLTEQAGAYVGNCTISYDVHEFKIGFTGYSATLGYDAPRAEVPTEVAATLRQVSADLWQGTLVGRRPEDPTSLIIRLRTSVAETPYGWYPIINFTQSGNSVLVDTSGAHLSPPSQQDLDIIANAKSLLAQPGAWSQTSTRNCDPAAKTFDLFCALRRATILVTGTFQYRQPAMQIVRAVVDEVASSEIKTHRLMEYNNSKRTSLSDIQHVLDVAYVQLNALMHKS